jgi:hypothetical protein
MPLPRQELDNARREAYEETIQKFLNHINQVLIHSYGRRRDGVHIKLNDFPAVSEEIIHDLVERYRQAGWKAEAELSVLSYGLHFE